MSERGIAWQRFDVIFKQEARLLVAALPGHFGLSLPPIVEQLATDLPRVDIHIEYMDALFRLADGSLLHIEFQTTQRRRDLARFALYVAELINRYRTEKIYTLVIYGAGIDSAPDHLDRGSLVYTVRNVFLGTRDGAAVLRHLQARLASTGTIDEDDRLDMVFLPLMRHDRPMVDVLTDAVEVIRRLPEPVQRQTFAGMLGIGYRSLTGTDLDSLVEKLMSTPTGLRLLDELLERGDRRYQEGRDQGLEQGILRGKREDILRILSLRFPAAPPTLPTRLQAVETAERLDSLLELALTVPSVEAFLGALPPAAA